MKRMFVCSECGAMLSQGPHSPDCSAIAEVHNSEPECNRCHQTMLIRDGEEPTEVCDHCAHAMLSAIADVVLNYRPKSKQPQPRQRRKAKHD